MSLEGLSVKSLLRTGEFRQVKSDTPIAIRIKHEGTAAVTSVTVTTATNIVLIDADGTNTLAFATYTTVGAVADAINALKNWSCQVLDALRSDASASAFVDGAITSGTTRTGVVVWDVLVDTSAALSLTACLSAFRDMSNAEVAKSKRVKLKKADYSVNMGTAAADSAQIWVRNGSKETQLVGDLSVDTTATTLYTGVGDPDAFLGGRAGEEIIVRVKDAATLADAAGNYVNAQGTIE